MAKSIKLSRYFTVILAAIVISFSLVSFFLPKSQFQILKEKLIRNPNDFEAHLELAERFLANNQYEKAERTLLLAEQIRNPKSEILNLEELWQKKHYSDPKDINKLIAAWEKILAEKPDYRDGWLQLAYLNYKIYEDNKAKEYLAKAIILDPNFGPSRDLEKIIQ